MEFIAILGLIYLAVKFSNLSKKVTLLEGKIREINIPVKTPHMQSVATPEPPEEQSIFLKPNGNEVPKIESFKKPETEVDISFDFLGWVTKNWLLKLGVLLILVGFGWFISYAFIHDWISPVGRVLLGLISGSALTLYGTLRMKKNTTQGKLFLILGSALAIITIYAAQTVYGFFPQTVTLSLIFLISVYIATIALLHKIKKIAVYGIAVAFLAPALTDVTVDVKIFFAYLAVVSLASLWLAMVRGWRDINAVSLIGFSLFAIPAALSNSASVLSPEGFFILATIFCLGLVYFIVSLLGAIKNHEEAGQGDVFVAVLDSVLIIVTTLSLVPESVQSFVLFSWMIVFAVGSFLTFSYTKKEKFFYVYSLISALFLIVATSIELDGSALVYAFAIETAIISLAGYFVTRKIDVGYNLSLLMAMPVVMSLSSLYSSSWIDGVLHDDFGILLTIGILLSGLGLFYFYSEREMKKRGHVSDKHFYSGLCLTGSLYFLALIWLIPDALIVNEGAAVLVSLVIYTILGISTYFYGLIKDREFLKYYGTALLIFVVLRLVFVDVWDMEIAERIITFISIGILFISTAFIGKKVKDGTVENIS